MTLRKTLAVTAAAVVMTLSAGAAKAQNCMDVLAGTPEASQFVNALLATGVATTLRSSSGPYTVLAPTNEAVNRLPIQLRNDVFGTVQRDQEMDPIQGPAVVNAHIIDGNHTSADAAAGLTFRTRNGNEIRLERGADGRYVLQPQGRGRRAVEAHVVRGDIKCSNGVIHLVDRVLIRQ